MDASMIKLQNSLSADWMQSLHYMSNDEIGWRFPEGSEVKRWEESGAKHVQAVFPFRRVMRRAAMGTRPLCVWRMLDGERVSDAIRAARELFELRTGQAASYAFVRTIPNKAEEGMDVHGCVLIQAEWAPEKCVVVL